MMASKRDHTSLDGEGPEGPASKRSKARQHQHAHMDPTWGQKYVFSSEDATTIPDDADVDFEDDGDAMEYLRSVRYVFPPLPTHPYYRTLNIAFPFCRVQSLIW
jgi:hypothetical protein